MENGGSQPSQVRASSLLLSAHRSNGGTGLVGNIIVNHPDPTSRVVAGYGRAPSRGLIVEPATTVR